MSHKDPTEQLRALHEQLEQLKASLSKDRQDVARLRRKVDLLRRLPADLPERIDPQLLEQMLEAEAARAAAQEARDFPAYVRQLEARVKRRRPDPH